MLSNMKISNQVPMRDEKGLDKKQTMLLFSLPQMTLLMKSGKTSNNSLDFSMADNRLNCIFLISVTCKINSLMLKSLV